MARGNQASRRTVARTGTRRFLVREGVVTVKELDSKSGLVGAGVIGSSWTALFLAHGLRVRVSIVTNAMGIRWAAAGPFLSFHAGGAGRPAALARTHRFERLWSVLGEPKFDRQTVDLLSVQAERALGKISYDELQTTRDRKQLAIMNALRRC